MITIDSGFFANEREYKGRGWWRDHTLVDDFLMNADRHPQKEAIVAVCLEGRDQIRLSYDELRERAYSIAAGLREAGVARGDVVALQLPNGWEFVAIVLAAYMIGAIICPITPILRARDVRHILKLTQARIVFLPSRFRRFDYRGMYEQIRIEEGLALDIVYVDGAAGSGRFDKSFVHRERCDGSPRREGVPASNDVAEILFTSGTTGEPKGVLHTHNTEFARARAFFEPLCLKAEDVVFMSSTMGHSSGFLYGLCVPFMLGMKAVYLDIHEADTMLDLIARERVTWTMGSTTFVIDAIAAQRRKPRGLESFHTFASGGAPIPPQVVFDAKDVLNTRVMAIWGMTENGGVTATPVSEPLEAAAENDGLPAPWMQVRVVDPSGAALPARATGALLVKGASQTPGYLHRAQLYNSCVDSEGWFDTGDLAYLDEEGHVRINGRSKDVIIRGGENIPVIEIEAAIYQMMQVHEAAVVAYPDERLGERACAVVTLEQGASSVTLRDVTDHLEILGVSKSYFPERLIVTDVLPKTMSGKIQKFVLRQMVTSGIFVEPDPDAIVRS